MGSAVIARLNDSGLTIQIGEDGVTQIRATGASHFSRGQSTSAHALYAWKVHVGLDAPVWMAGDGLRIAAEHGARVLLTPPNWRHATGAVGWSLAMFIDPGPHRWRSQPHVLTGAAAERIIDACRRHELSDDGLLPTIAELALPAPTGTLDARVEGALERLRHDANLPLANIARAERCSLDRLSRLVSQQTGMTLRRHRLWNRLRHVLSAQPSDGALAATAFDAGFADHAHMTRTFRAFLGRAPSEFKRPPEILAPWL